MHVKTWLCLGLVLSVSACGGGGDNNSSSGSNGDHSTPAPSVAITTSNSNQVAATAESGDSVAKNSAGGYAPLALNSSSFNVLTARALAKNIFHLGSSQSLQPFATTACDNAGGTATVTDGLAGTTSGSITFNNCLFSGVIFDGTVSKILASGNTDTDNFDVTVAFTDFKVVFGQDSTTLNATMHIVSSTDGTTLTVDINFPNFHVTHNADYVGLYDFTLHSSEVILTHEYTLSYSYTFDSNLINGAVQVATQTDITGNSTLYYPYTGSVLITGANNARILVATNGDGTSSALVTVQIDANGDGAYETTRNMTWAEFDAASLLQ